MKFSDRIGITKPRDLIQMDSMDQILRNKLWTYFYFYYIENLSNSGNIISRDNSQQFIQLMVDIWSGYYNSKLDELPTRVDNLVKKIKNDFDNKEWYEVYNFIEFIVNKFEIDEINYTFIKNCNKAFERELSAYRFIDKLITPITSEVEIESIEKALDNSTIYSGVYEHLKTSLDLLSNKTMPNYRNSIKESVSAVESLCSILTNEPSLSLGQSLKKLEDKGIVLNTAFKKGLSNIYGYTSEADGIRHGLLEESNLKLEDARFMLVLCSAFVNYLIEKSNNINTIPTY